MEVLLGTTHDGEENSCGGAGNTRVGAYIALAEVDGKQSLFKIHIGLLVQVTSPTQEQENEPRGAQRDQSTNTQG